MSKPSTRKNFILYYLYQATILLSTIITTPYISKILGSKNLGIYSYTFSIANCIYIFAQLGTSTYGVREIAINKDVKAALTKSFLGIEIMTIITTIICTLIYILFVVTQTDFKIYFYLWILFIISAAFDITWFYAGIEHFEEIFIINIIIRMLGIVSIFAFVRNINCLWIYIIIHSLMYLLPFALMWFALHKYIDVRNFKNLNLKNHFKQSFIYFIPTIAASLFMIIDKSMLGFIIEDKRESGYYEMASEIIIFGKTLTAVVIAHIFEPKTTYHYKNQNLSKIKDSISLSLEFTMFLCIGIIFGIFSIAHIFVPVFFGNDFLPVENLLKIMSPLLIITSISYILEYEYLMPAGKGKNINIYIIISAVFNIILNIILITNFKSIGAVIASIITEIFVLICFYIKSDNILELLTIFNASYKKIIAGIIMSFIIHFTHNFFINNTNIGNTLLLIIEIIVGIISYTISLILLKDKMLNFIKDINTI